VVTQQHSRKLLMMDIVMSETCWVYKKWNKIASGIMLVFCSSAITMMHGAINISFLSDSVFGTWIMFIVSRTQNQIKLMRWILKQWQIQPPKYYRSLIAAICGVRRGWQYIHIHDCREFIFTDFHESWKNVAMSGGDKSEFDLTCFWKNFSFSKCSVSH
jgi:hypothetical protein